MCVTCETEELCHCATVVGDPRNIADITAASTALEQESKRIEQENKRIKSILASVSHQLDATDSDTRHVDVSITAANHAIAPGEAGPEIEDELLHARNILRVTANRNSHSQQCLHVPAPAQGSSNPDDTDPTFRPVDFYRSRADLINESL